MAVGHFVVIHDKATWLGVKFNSLAISF